MSENGVKIVIHVRDERRLTTVLNYLSVTFPLAGLLRGFRLIWLRDKSISHSSAGVPCKYVMSVMDHLTRYALFIPIPNKSANTVARMLVDRVFTTFAIPEKFTFRFREGI